MDPLIEEYTHEADGYRPFLIRDNWQVAQLNYENNQGFGDIEKIDIHFQTDEVFILLEGQVVLIVAEKEGDRLSLRTVKMEKGVTYNIPKNTWHNIAMSQDAKVIIVEDANTHLGDYEFYYMGSEQKSELYRKIHACL